MFLFSMLQDGRIDYSEFVAMMQKGNSTDLGVKEVHQQIMTISTGCREPIRVCWHGTKPVPGSSLSGSLFSFFFVLHNSLLSTYNRLNPKPVDSRYITGPFILTFMSMTKSRYEASVLNTGCWRPCPHAIHSNVQQWFFWLGFWTGCECKIQHTHDPSKSHQFPSMVWMVRGERSTEQLGSLMVWVFG